MAIDPELLARELADIARETKDADTATRLMEVVERLLREAELP